MSTPARRRLAALGKGVLRIGPLVLLVVALARARPWTMDLSNVAGMPIVLAIAINLGIYLPLRVFRWRAALASPPPFLQLLFALVEGFLVGTAVGFGTGDAVRSARLRTQAGTFARDFGSTMAERAAEVCALALLMLLATGMGMVGTWAAIAAAAMIGAYLGALAVGTHIALRLQRWPRVAEGLTALLMASTPGRVAAITTLTLAGWVAEIVILTLVLGAFGLAADVGTALMVVIGINIAITIPGPPANLGTFEAGVVGALALRGVATAPAVTFAVAYHLIMTIPIIILGGAVYLVRERARRNQSGCR